MWIEDYRRLAMYGTPPAEALFLGDDGMRELVAYAQQFGLTPGAADLTRNAMEPQRVTQFLGLPVVPMRSGRPWSVEMHGRDYGGLPQITVLR